MIAEAAYHLAEKRGFLGEHSLDDWLAAEQQVRQVISEVTVKDLTRQNEPKPQAKALQATESAGKVRREDPLPQSKRGQATRESEEKLGANMADRK
jgi:hypothetical protein